MAAGCDSSASQTAVKPVGAPMSLQALTADEDQPKAYYTQGKTIVQSARTYLIAYRPPENHLDIAALMNLDKTSQNITPDKVMDMLAPTPKPDTALSINVIDLSTVARIESIRTFDLKVALADRSLTSGNTMILAAILFPVFWQARLKAQEVSSVSNLKQVALATLMYAQDHDERLPPLKDPTVWKKALIAYSKNEGIFKDPRTGEVYQANAAASRKSLAAIANPAEFVVFYKSSPSRGNTRAVAFADGHVRRLSETEWLRAKRKSGIP